MAGWKKGDIAPAGMQKFCYFAFDFINFAVPLYAGRTAAAPGALPRAAVIAIFKNSAC